MRVELRGRAAERIGGLQGMPALDAPTALGTLPDMHRELSDDHARDWQLLS